MFVVQRLEPHFPQASKTSIGHVVQLLYRASCFKVDIQKPLPDQRLTTKVTKRDGDSSLMQLKEEFRTYDTLRREHDTQIVQIATEGGLRIAPDQWSSLLYGDSAHKSHMQVMSCNSILTYLLSMFLSVDHGQAADSAKFWSVGAGVGDRSAKDRRPRWSRVPQEPIGLSHWDRPKS